MTGCGWGAGDLPQGREIFGRLTVEDNLRMGLASRPGGGAIPAELFELFPVLKRMIHRRAGDLSGGQQQLAVARALAAGPKLLMLDEPTEGIQPSIIKDIGRVIRMLAERGTMAIVLVEQYCDFAAELADQYLVMERGEIVLRGRGAAMAADRVRERMSIRGFPARPRPAGDNAGVKQARPPLVRSWKHGTGGKSGLHRAP
jgi:urea transport system ATP-binding protein